MNCKYKKSVDIIEQIFRYQRRDNKFHCIAVIINRRFIKEDKKIKLEESKGFKHVCALIRCEAAKLGVKAYYTSHIEQNKNSYCSKEDILKNDDGKLFPVETPNIIGGWLFETGKSFNEERVLQAVDIFRSLLSKGISDGSIILEKQKRSKTSKHKPASVNLEDEIDQLRVLLALKMKVHKEIIYERQL